LSQNHRGLSTYVQPGDALDEMLSEFYARISTPVLTGLQLDFGPVTTYDLYPQPLPDLFLGTQVVLVGRYRTGGVTDIELSGEVNAVEQSFRFEDQAFATDSRGSDDAMVFLPRLWATRKIGYLLNRIRLQGPDQETIDQIVRISIRYGIVTPYTSYLVTEEAPLGAENQERLAMDTFRELQAAPSAPVFGQAAVEKAAGEGALSQADQAFVFEQTGDQRQSVRILGARTFVLSDEAWIDTAYDPDSMQTQKVAFLSSDYFALANSRQDVGAALAQAERVIVVVDGRAYEIVNEDDATAPLILPEPGQAPAEIPVETAPISGPDLVDVEPVTPQQTALPVTCLGGFFPMILASFALFFLRKH
jgi:Ca-activated chloride channel homolog